MKKPSLLIFTLIYLAALAAIRLRTEATPTCDEDTTASGCIAPQGGGKANFNLSANFEVATHAFSGHLTYADTNANVDITSNDLKDYGTVGGNVRSFKFQITNDNYDEARVIASDNGEATNDGFEIQLLKNGNIVYQVSGPLNADCPGGVVITPHCENQPPCLIQLSVQCAVKPPTNAMPSSDSCSVVGTNRQVDFFYTIKNGGTNELPLSSVTASDSFGSLDLSSLGSGSIAPGEELTLMVTETITGSLPFTNTVTVAGGQTNNQCSASDSVVIKQKEQNPPPQECDDFVTGGGWIVGTPSGDRANFGVHGGIKKKGLWGGLNYIDHHTGMHVKSTAVTGYSHVSDVGRQINFNVKIDGQPGTAIVKVYDNGEPGRNDIFSIQLSNGYTASGDLGGPCPGGGNIQLHKSNCDKDQDHGKDHDRDKDKCPHSPKCKSKSECDHKIKADKEKEKDRFTCPHTPRCKSKSECDDRNKHDKDSFKCPHHPQCKTKGECTMKQLKVKKH